MPGTRWPCPMHPCADTPPVCDPIRWTLFPLALDLAMPTSFHTHFPLDNALGLFVSMLPFQW
ncbi:hypothetical protein TRAPUB_1518 [Trametes pubescens]|uniref:Uncharacterized protein n=1 Tax=Trametes pubescens TaxID=154538 RepID=A0A1M2VJ59_TRAPU|nr:hypothetical protein TRAPUB_1518 [Trametes pubescens]